MALRVVWNKRAKTNFDKVLKYLDIHFGENTKKAFVQRSFTIIENLQEFPKLGTVEVEDKNIRGFLITKHNRLFYRYSNTQLILLNFFDTRQDTSKK